MIRRGARLALFCWVVSAPVAAADGGDAAAWAQDAAPIELTILGGSAQGTLAPAMEALGEMIRREYPGSAYSYEPYSGAGALIKLARGEVGIGIGAPVEMRAALTGSAPFSEAVAADAFSVVARLIDGMFAYVLVTREFMAAQGVQSLADLAARRPPVRLSLGQPGTLTIRRQALAFLAHYGLDPQRIETWDGVVYSLPLGASADLVKDRRADMIFTVGFYPDRRVLELTRALPVTFLPLGEAAVRSVAAELGIESGLVPAGAYEFLDRDYFTTMAGMLIIAGPAAEPRTVYKVAKAFHRRFDYLQGLHPLFAQARPERLPHGGIYPLHPAAARYYREAGLLE